VLINGFSIGTVAAPTMTGMWQAFGFQWDAGVASSAIVSIVDLNHRASGNDFVLDDLGFQAVPGPAVLTALALACGVSRGRRKS
jgi:hypothetical protein